MRFGSLSQALAKARRAAAKAKDGIPPIERAERSRKRTTEIRVKSPDGREMNLETYRKERGLSKNGALYRYHVFGPHDPRFWGDRICGKGVPLGGACRDNLRVFTWKGKSRTASEWAEHLNISVQAFWYRVYTYGENDPRTYAPPKRRKTRKISL